MNDSARRGSESDCWPEELLSNAVRSSERKKEGEGEEEEEGEEGGGEEEEEEEEKEEMRECTKTECK